MKPQALLESRSTMGNRPGGKEVRLGGKSKTYVGSGMLEAQVGGMNFLAQYKNRRVRPGPRVFAPKRFCHDFM